MGTLGKPVLLNQKFVQKFVPIATLFIPAIWHVLLIPKVRLIASINAYKRVKNTLKKKTAKELSRVSPTRSIDELELTKRANDALLKAGITNVGDFMKKYEEGEKAVLAISGFGQKSLIDAKKVLRSMGYELPDVE